METAPRRALILVDVQNEYFDGPLRIRHPAPTESLPRILGVIAAANDASIPVVCVLASAVEGEAAGFVTEVLSDATGAIHIADDAGSVDARTLHEVLMALLHSNWAAAVDSETWRQAVIEGRALPHSNLVASALAGAERFGDW